VTFVKRSADVGDPIGKKNYGNTLAERNDDELNLPELMNYYKMSPEL
jgi:hypothetical protein